MRKFLVVVDETPECMNAMRFAARRAQKTGGGVVMLYVITPDDFQHFLGVAEVMRDGQHHLPAAPSGAQPGRAHQRALGRRCERAAQHREPCAVAQRRDRRRLLPVRPR